jgi:predicted GIY-YIG superfamily endonuclease
MSYFVYLLLSSDNNTYVGATVDLDRRLRQHNKEIKGGAHATSVRVMNGEMWVRVAHIKGFPNWKAALQFEWRWKQLSRRLMSKYTNPLQRRMQALHQLLQLNKPTSKAMLYSDWESPPEVVLEDDEARRWFDSKSA